MHCRGKFFIEGSECNCTGASNHGWLTCLEQGHDEAGGLIQEWSLIDVLEGVVDCMESLIFVSSSMN
jgi:hypothetical protein